MIRALGGRSRPLPAFIAVAALAGCGGGGGGGGSEPAQSAVEAPPTVTVNGGLVVDCAGTYCGAVDERSYVGAGIGIWRYTNSGDTPVELSLEITGAGGRTATLVFSNNTGSAQAMPDIPLANVVTRMPPVEAVPEHVNVVPARIRDYVPPLGLPGQPALRAAPRVVYGVGDSRDWYHEDNSRRTATLKRQVTAADGRKVNFWVENGEYGDGAVTAAKLDTLAQRFAGAGDSVYAMATGIAGQPWGPHGYSGLIGASQPLDVVLLNFDRNGAPYGLVGYYWARNNFTRALEPYSNESLSFYLDTETLYRSISGFQVQISTLAHEFAHMINFYQRAVLMGADARYATWLEEMTAMMMEDITSLKLDPTYNTIRDERFLGWISGPGFNCDPTAWDDGLGSPCFAYNVAGSFGGWLLRQYGIDFYRDLLRNRSSIVSRDLLSNVIRDAGGDGYADAVRHWGTSSALLPAAGSPAGFGYPERIDSGYTLPALDGPAYAQQRQMPLVVPARLAPWGHFPVLRENLPEPYSETVTVPAGSTLTVIVTESP